MSEVITKLRSMAASEWANVYEHREFLLSVAALLTEYEADEPRKELAWVRRECAELEDKILEARHGAAKAHETAMSLAARLAEARHDIGAYRSALGYSVPADHDGRLSDGTTPICGLCDARAKRLAEHEEKDGQRTREHNILVRENREAGHLLDDALHFLRLSGHFWNCPRNRDDYDCTCGLSDLKHRIKEWLK